MAELYWGNKRVLGIKPPGGEYVDLCTYTLVGLDVTVPEGTTSLAASAFKDSSLVSITIPSSVTSLGNYCFQGCSGLTSVTIPSSVTTIGTDCFKTCYNLVSATISSSIDTLPQGCFYYCTGLTSVTLPSSIKTLGQGCFQGCSSLATITIPLSVTSVGKYCFQGCSSLKKIYFEGNPPTISSNSLSGLTLAIYHKADNSKWKSSIKTSTYGGASSVTWGTY